MPSHVFQPAAETDVQAGGGNADFFSAGLEVFQLSKAGDGQVAGAQKVEQAFAPAVDFGQQQHAVRWCWQVAFELGQRVFGAAHDGQIGQGGRILAKASLRVDASAGAALMRQLRKIVGSGIKLLGA